MKLRNSFIVYLFSGQLLEWLFWDVIVKIKLLNRKYGFKYLQSNGIIRIGCPQPV